MATKKPKASSKTAKAKTTKPKTATKTVLESVSEAPKNNSSSSKKTEKSCFRNFFAKKYTEHESIMTVFKNRKFYGALLGEVIGTMLVTLVLFAFFFTGVYDAERFGGIVLIAIYIAVYAFSGACLNPIITVGMMASRRMSVIRGVMYIIAEVIGSWLAWLVFNTYNLNAALSSSEVPSLAAIGDGQFWAYAITELLGAVTIAFFFARALQYKRSVFTFAFVATAGILLAFFVGYILSAGYLQLQNNFIFNPATAMMLNIFPQSGENFGEIVGGICQALSVYAILPMLGGAIGFFISDFTSKLSGEE